MPFDPAAVNVNEYSRLRAEKSGSSARPWEVAGIRYYNGERVVVVPALANEQMANAWIRRFTDDQVSRDIEATRPNPSDDVFQEPA